jgi:hypothetical protein
MMIEDEAALILTKFFRFVKSMSGIMKVIQMSRERKRLEAERKQLEEESALKIQTAIRGFLVRAYIRRQIHHLKAQRIQRIADKRNRMALKLQLMFRVKQARDHVKRRIKEIEAEKQRLAKMSEVERLVDQAHRNQKLELMVCRIQRAFRVVQARKELQKRMYETQLKEKQEKRRIEREAAVRLQRHWRGTAARRWFQTVGKQRMCMEMERRRFCHECEENMATRRCLGCNGDRYCDACFSRFHRKGRKKEHEWVLISGSSDTVGDEKGGEEEEEGTKMMRHGVVVTKGDGPPPLALKPKVSKEERERLKAERKEQKQKRKQDRENKKQQRKQKRGGSKNGKDEEDASFASSLDSGWVEYWDDEAQSVYYYNENTGEASWTLPTESG